MASYITQVELAYALSATSFAAIFDQDNDGIADGPVVDAVIARASGMVDAWIAPVYAGPFPIVQSPVPSMIRELTISYAVAIGYERRPDVTRSLQGSTDNDTARWKRADEMGQRLQSAVLRIPDLTAQPKPANVTGSVVYTDDRRRISDGNGGDF